jgi:hypothetical protein
MIVAIRLVATSARYAIVKPAITSPRLDSLFIADDVADFLAFVRDIPKDEKVVAIDTETTGTKFWLSDFRIVTIGLSCSIGSIALDTRELSRGRIKHILLQVSHLPLVAHNLQFDAGAMTSVGINFYDMNWQWDTFGLYHQLANEGFPGQKHGLSEAQKDMLNWAESNKDEVAEWLIENGHIKGRLPNKLKQKLETPSKWQALTPEEYRKVIRAADRSKLHLVEAPVLSKYCALDCDSTWQLATEVLLPALDRVPPQLAWFHRGPYLELLEVLVDTARTGIPVDIDRMKKYDAYLDVKIRENLLAFRSHPSVAPFIEEIERQKLQKLLAGEPAKYVKPKTLWLERNEFRSKRKAVKVRRLSKNWKLWKEKVKLVEKYKKDLNLSGLTKSQCKVIRENTFNAASGDQLKPLLYGNIFQYKTVKEHVDKDNRGSISLVGQVDGNDITDTVELGLTKSGGLPVSKTAYKQMGTIGKLLLTCSKTLKERTYVTKVIANHATSEDGLLHPTFKCPGTFTGRLAGMDGFNFQNLPNSPAFMECFKMSDPDRVLLGADFCLRAGTELLTKERGWVDVMSLEDTDLVWQVNNDTLIGGWCKPSRLIKRHYDGPMYEVGNRRGSFHVTEGHTMLYVGQHHATRTDKEKKRWIVKSEDGIPSTGCNLILGSERPTQVSESHFSERDIWLAAMTQADGSHIAKDRYKVEVSLTRKRTKVQELLGAPGHVAHRVQNGKEKLPSESWHYRFSSPLIDQTADKNISIELIGDNQLDTFLEALSFWDGSIEKCGDRFIYHSVNERLIDRIQAHLVCRGYEAKKVLTYKGNSKHRDCYCLRIQKENRVRVRPNMDIRQYSYVGDVGCVTVDSGFILIRSEGQTFVTGNCALEPHALAELSRDKTYLEMYGPDAADNLDVYLHVGAKISKFAKQIADAGYSTLGNTPEALAMAKSTVGDLRGKILKVLQLSSAYGAGPFKIWQTLKLQGVDISLKEVEDIHADYWSDAVFGGVKKFEAILNEEHRRNKGWVLDGIGNPVCCDSGKKKDLVNRVIQRTGHSVLVIFLQILKLNMREAGIDLKWYIPDLHDETIYSVPKDQLELALRVHNESVAELNELLGGLTKHACDPKVIAGLHERKD